MSGMENLEKAAMIAAVAAEVAAGGQAVKTESAGLIQNEKAKTEQTSQRHGENAAMQQDENGRYFMIIDGKKQFFNQEVSLSKPVLPKIESTGGTILSGEDDSKKMAATDAEE
jgi:hypothetical protein